MTLGFWSKSLCALLAASAFTLFPTRPAGAQALDPISGHYYDIVDQAHFWNDAVQDAEAHTYKGMQGYLVTITSQEENDFLTNTFGDKAREKWTGAYRTGDGSDPNANWHWLNGELWNYTNWAPGEPNNSGSGENRMSLKGGDAPLGTWNDTSSDGFAGYILEYSATPVPEAATAVSFALLLTLSLGALVIAAKRKQKSA